MDLQRLLEDFYAIYNPEKSTDVLSILNKFQGTEEELFCGLLKKYKVLKYAPFQTYLKELSTDHKDTLRNKLASQTQVIERFVHVHFSFRRSIRF